MIAVIYLCILIILLHESSSEVCMPLFQFDDPKESLYSGQFERLYLNTGEVINFEYVKPNKSALCSTDHENKLDGKIIRVGVDELYPYVMYSKVDKTVTGLFGEAWTILEKTLRFKSVYEMNRNIPILETGKLDLMLIPASVEKSGLYFTSSTEIYKNSYSLFMLSDGVSVAKWWYLRIFDKYVWSLLMFVIAVLTISVICISNIIKKLCKETKYYDGFSSPAYSLLCIIGATTGQGIPEMPRMWSLRFCALSALQLGMLLSCAFNSTLTSYLALRSHETKINSLDDVWKYGTHSLCVRNQSFAQRELQWIIEAKKSSGELTQKYTQLINKNCPDMDNEHEVRKYLCKAGFIFVESYDRFLRMYQQIENECKIVKIPGYYWSSGVALTHYAGSKYRKILNTYLMKLRSSGILKYLEEKWTLTRSLQNTHNEFQPVELGHIEIIVFGLLMMILISILICVFENLWYNFFNRRRRFSYSRSKSEEPLLKRQYSSQKHVKVSYT